MSGTVTNCYSDTQLAGTQGGTVNGGVKDADDFASGEVTWLLNGESADSPAWYQNLDNGQTVDEYPVLDRSHGAVYRIEGDPVSYSNDPNGNPAQVISVDITWGDLSFTYSDGSWNAGTHSYEGGGWTADAEGGDAITVANTGEAPVTADYTYQPVETGITGSFANSDGNPVTTPATLQPNGTSTVLLALTGKPDKNLDASIIGTVTVTIGGESE